MPSFRSGLVWAGLVTAVAAPVALATVNPLLAWRDPVYIAAGFAGIAALALVLFQPLLAAGVLPGLPPRIGRRVHRLVGIALVAAVVAHVAGLWVTSPPDAIDALLLMSPTPFSVWGVLAMWAIFGAALIAALRGPLRIRPKAWRIAHTALALVIVVGSILHALLIEGAMEPVSKAALCALVAAALAMALANLRSWTLLSRDRGRSKNA